MPLSQYLLKMLKKHLFFVCGEVYYCLFKYRFELQCSFGKVLLICWCHCFVTSILAGHFLSRQSIQPGGCDDSLPARGLPLSWAYELLSCGVWCCSSSLRLNDLLTFNMSEHGVRMDQAEDGKSSSESKCCANLTLWTPKIAGRHVKRHVIFKNCQSDTIYQSQKLSKQKESSGSGLMCSSVEKMNLGITSKSLSSTCKNHLKICQK